MSSTEETQLADDLRHLVAGEQFVTDIEAIERRGRRQQRRGVVIRAMAGAGVLGLAVAGGLVAASRTSTPGEATGKPAISEPATGHPATASSVPVQTVAYVRQRISAALNTSGYLIKAVEDNSADGAFTDWTDPATGNTMLLRGSGPGKIAYWEHDYYQDKVLHWHQTQVNYGPRTWWVYDEHAAGPIQGPVPPGPVGGNDPTSAFRHFLADGAAKIVGHPVVDGRRTIELSVAMGPTTEYFWADSHTYQVIEAKRLFGSALGNASTTSVYYYVPSTPAMVNLINHPQVPAGFTQVPAD
jgi:hypothetical protein